MGNETGAIQNLLNHVNAFHFPRSFGYFHKFQIPTTGCFRILYTSRKKLITLKTVELKRRLNIRKFKVPV